MSQSFVALIVLNYNTTRRVIALFEHVVSIRPAGSPIQAVFVIVDNASTPAETERLVSYFRGRPNCHLLLSPTNSGYAAGNNLGLRFAAEHGFDFCLIANSDISFLCPDFLEQLVHAARSLPNCGLIGPKVVLQGGRPQGPLPVLGILNSVFPMRSRQIQTVRPVHATVGCCIFGSAAILRQVGFLDANTFLYREENILAERLRESGRLWYYLPTVTVQHNHERKVQSRQVFLFHKGCERRSTAYYFRRYRHRSSFAIFMYYNLIWLKIAVGVAICAIRQRRRPHSA